MHLSVFLFYAQKYFIVNKNGNRAYFPVRATICILPSSKSMIDLANIYASDSSTIFLSLIWWAIFIFCVYTRPFGMAHDLAFSSRVF